MAVGIKIDGVSVNRCSQDAVIASGTNSITQRSSQKRNEGVELIGSGQLRMEQEFKLTIDPDHADHSVWSGDNWTIKPS